LLFAATCFCQIPPLKTADLTGEATDWMEAGAYHVAIQKLAEILRASSFTEQNRDVLFWLVQSSFKDQQYEEAYQWGTEFLQENPNDVRRVGVLFMQGVSAYHTRRLDDATRSLGEYLKEGGDHPERGAGCFWHAMAELDKGDTAAAQNDIQRCMDDPSSRTYRDYILMGWALSLERRGNLDEAADRLDRLLSEYPQSELATDARLRIASISLRQGRLARTLKMLDETSPSLPSQHQEYLLLRAEANLRLGRYSAAHDAYEEFTSKYEDSPYERNARYGLAWSLVKLHDYSTAQIVFDSLSTGKDSLAFASMYQSGILSLLRGKMSTALTTLDSLTSLSPYDRDAVSAYYQMGMIEYRSKHYREARRYFQLAARLFPESNLRAAAYRMLGESNMAIGDFSNAQYAFGQVRHLNAQAELLAPSLFQEGVSLYHLGRFRTCEERFKEFLDQYPGNPRAGEAYVWRGEALYQDSRFPEAERSYSDALRLFPKNPRQAQASYGYAWSLFEEKRFSPAADAFERFSKSYPNDAHTLDAKLRKADCYFATGEYDKAEGLYASLATEKASSRQVEYAAFQLAMSYIQRGESDRGIGQLRDFLGRYPSSMYAEIVQFNIGWTYFSREQYTDAVTELKTVLRKYGDSQILPRVLFNLGDAYYNLKQYDSARVYYQRVIKEYPSSLLVADALSGLQYTYEAEGKPAGALAEIEKVIRDKPAGAPEEELLLKKGDILFGQGDFAGAIGEYQRVLAMKTAPLVKGKALYQLGRSYEQEDNPLRAISFYEQVPTEAPGTDIIPQAALALGLAHLKAKHYARAADALKDFGRRFPDSPLLAEAQYQLGTALSNTADKEGAAAQFGLLIRDHPGDIFADRSRLRIAQIDHDRKKNQAAIDTLSGVVNRRSDDIAAEALLMIGDNYLSMKRTKDALQAYEDVIRQYTEFPRIVERARLGEGECYEKLHDTQRARSTYEGIRTAAVDPGVRKEAEDRLRRIRR